MSLKFWNSRKIFPPSKLFRLSIKNPFLSRAFRGRQREKIFRSLTIFCLASMASLRSRIRENDLSANHCLESQDCCAVETLDNRFCYRRQCFYTAKKIAESLQIAPERMTVSFQSRLGKTPWIRPYTDEVIQSLAEKGTKRSPFSTLLRSRLSGDSRRNWHSRKSEFFKTRWPGAHSDSFAEQRQFLDPKPWRLFRTQSQQFLTQRQFMAKTALLLDF